MKTANMARSRHSGNRQAGQTTTLIVLALGLFLLGAIGIAVDISNWWFHRQMAQGAADAACTAGIMDMLANAEGQSVGNFPSGSPPAAYTCSSSGASTSAPCAYANLNGYSGAGRVAGQPSNDVQVIFPTTLPGSGLQVCSSTVPPPCIPATVASPYLVINVFDRTPTTFTGLLRGSTTVDVAASAACALTYADAPIPILVLDPQNPNIKPAVSALNVQGTPTITIVGGPQKSIQVNTADSGKAGAAVTVGGNALIDLHLGGPAGPPGTGSDIGIFGAVAEPAVPKNFNPGTTGHWEQGAPVSDPFAQVCAPSQSTDCLATINGFSAPTKPGAPAVPADQTTKGCTSIPCAVAYQDHGCPNTAATRSNGKCLLYTAGLYDSTTGFSTGIQIGPGGGTSGIIGLFDPGLYYIGGGAAGGLSLNSLSTVRPGTGVGDGSGGVVFYFAGVATVGVASNSGSVTFDPFNSLKGPVDSSGTAYPDNSTTLNKTYGNGVKCASGSVVPTNLQGGGAGVNIQGNILLGACSGYYGDPLGTSEPAASGEQHQFLFFQDRSGTSVNPQWGGGGQFLLAGTMYFRSCNSSGTGVNCGAVGTYWNDIFTLQGNSGSGTYVLGEIVTDNLSLGGTSGITMDLNPNVAYPILKATLIQ
jgi:Putative Flp pilus-assembly TadE/G-like